MLPSIHRQTFPRVLLVPGLSKVQALNGNSLREQQKTDGAEEGVWKPSSSLCKAAPRLSDSLPSPRLSPALPYYLL